MEIVPLTSEKKNNSRVFCPEPLKLPRDCVIFGLGVEFLFKTVTVELENNR